MSCNAGADLKHATQRLLPDLFPKFKKKNFFSSSTLDRSRPWKG
jgi:hypothetical protein